MFLYNISKFLESPFRSDFVVKINLIISLVFNIITWVILYLKIYPLSYLTEFGQVYLHYNIYFGIDNIGDWHRVFIIPILGLFIIIFNNILAYSFYNREKLISHTLLISQSILQAILFAAAVFIILLNT